jgi:hypothetical protein
LLESNSPARQKEVDISVVAQKARRLEHDDGIVGKAEIAGQTNDKRVESERRSDFQDRPRLGSV